VVGYGIVVPEGSLPVFSTRTAEEAKHLIVLACPTNFDGEYYAKELAQEQTLENLVKFSDRLQYCWDIMEANKKKTTNEKVLVQRSSGNRKKKHRQSS